MPSALLLELQKYKDVVRCAGTALGKEVPRTPPSRIMDVKLDNAFIENSLVFTVPKIGRARAPLAPPPGTCQS